MRISRRGFVRMGAAAAAGAVCGQAPARVHVCERGSHLCMWDDQESYFAGLLTFIDDVEAGRFPLGRAKA